MTQRQFNNTIETNTLSKDIGNERVLIIRLPCNPIFPIGPIYLADHLHKCFPTLPQKILDLAALPVVDVERILVANIKNFKPTTRNSILGSYNCSV